MAWTKSFIVIISTFIICGCALPFQDGFGVRSISETKGFQTDSDFHFTISPNDQWLLFFVRVSEEGEQTRHYKYGNLRLLNLKTGQIHRITLTEKEAPGPIINADAAWVPDSSNCVLPPPLTQKWPAQHAILVDVHEEANVRTIPAQVQHGKDRAVKVANDEFKMPTEFGCSDCYLHTNDIELMRKSVDAKYLRWGDSSINRNEHAAQIVSPDGKHVYYQKGPEDGTESEETTLYERDISSGKERRLISHKGECPVIDRLRPSPDGKHLAYQLTTGCGFIAEPIVYVLDLKACKTKEVARASGGTMHWTSTSDRLFFYYRDFLYVAEFENPKPTAATRPTDKPAENPGP